LTDGVCNGNPNIIRADTARLSNPGESGPVPFNEEGQQRSAIVTGAARHRTRDRAAAGGGRVGGVGGDLPSTAEQWQRTLDVNVTGVAHCYSAAARQMIPQGRGGRLIGAA